MPHRPRIQFDLSRSRNHSSQHTNETNLVVGRQSSSYDLTSNVGSTSGTRSEIQSSTTSQISFSRTKNSTEGGRSSKALPFGVDKNSQSCSIDLSIPDREDYRPVQIPVKFHETRTSSDDILIDPNIIPGARVGDIGELRCVDGKSPRKLYFMFNDFRSSQNPLNSPVSNTISVSNRSQVNSANTNVVSVKLGPIQKLLDLKPRALVQIQVVPPEDIEADVVEIYIKDLHLSRGDMWNLSNMLVHSCLYRTQKLSFLQGAIRGDVHRIYRHGKKIFSGYVGENTKVVFRSESARLVVFIQISMEMWHFEESGQQMFYKLVNSLFPKVFKRWKKLGTHHLITIVLFTSVDLDEHKHMKYAAGERPAKKRDYYRVVVDQVSILLWNDIMATLRLEFSNFKKDILFCKNRHVTKEHPQKYVINGNFLPAVKGNLLEAINLGMSLVSNDFRDPDLRQTTNHFIIISPGNGLFDVDYNMLLETGKMLATVDSTIDVICLSQPPLHVVPLFRYLDSQHKPRHCIPNFMDISFWSDATQAVHQWLPRCKIYELQMMGVMENELTSININELNLGNHHSSMDAMTSYDVNVFRTPYGHRRRKLRERKAARSIKSKVLENRPQKQVKPSTQVKKQNSSGVTATDIPSNTNNTELSPKLDIQAMKGFGVSDSGLMKASQPKTSNAVGTTTTAKSNVSALSSLLQISKTGTTHSVLRNPLNFVKKIITSPLSSPISPISSGSRRIKPSESDITAVPLSVNTDSSGSEISSHKELSSQYDVLKHKLSEIPETDEDNNTSATQPSSLAPKEETKLTKKSHVDAGNSYWTTVKNPSNVTTAELLGLVSYGRWQFVFPPNVRRRIIKWTSLASPAALPVMTPLFPSIDDFHQNFNFRIYDVLLNPSGVNKNCTSKSLMRSMISLRLSLGFQICVGDRVRQVEDQRKPNGDSKELIEYLNTDQYEGSRIYLSLSDEIHRISCDYNGLVNVQVYTRNTSGEDSNRKDLQYVEYIRTRYSEHYSSVPIRISKERIRNYNWNKLDQILAGYNDSVGSHAKYYRLKFVILPTQVPENSFKLGSEKLSPEEIRLEGIRSLVATINRNRYRTAEEKKIRSKKSEIMPEINFYTGNLFKYLNNRANLELSGEVKQSQLFSSPKFNKSISLKDLARVLQEDKGVKISDRKWHLVTHSHCFIGTDFVSWLIENFEDIDNRDEAVIYGNRLMDEHLFRHVTSKHHFLDGHYFYEINEQYMHTDDANKDKKKNETDESKNGEKKGETNDAKPEGRRVVLSRKVLYDLDPNHCSWQPELMNVHYDIVHNPEHCFHVRLEWLNTTSKLIEDTISSWGKHCERYGLELVEIPWEELCSLPKTNPLHSTIDISLALNPWEDSEFSKYTNLLKENKYFYHLYLLEKCEFMLDNRTANLSEDTRFDPTYSWGQPNFKYAQFIHTTGAYIAELKKNGEFFLAPNNAHIARVNLSIGQLQGSNRGTVYFDSQGVMLDFRAICNDRNRLRTIFREAIEKYEESHDVELALFETDTN